ncbi:MAG: tRNA (adenosine(37)-N6)-threonylcarbamoyltransferase complex dimerization subunit type 1 TsaB [Bacteroidales bacterium]|nr:tRNA (adenosine(37)-N6)-threonylcarbamoyltransferase complex dimerization subunit type 1 TsaB [Bacteroidales bacterium]
MFPQLLLIETSTEVCSVALSRGDQIICSRTVKEPKSHARIIAPLIQEIMSECSTSIGKCHAVVVSEGPGSYTGLRVGASIAKGLCYGASIPLIAVSSLELLARIAVSGTNKFPPSTILVPMIDARRMEVYTAKYNTECKALSQTEAVVITSESFAEELSKGIVVFTGDGAPKCKDIITHPNALFLEGEANATGMLIPALKKFKDKEFADVAYFEPFYLKDFVAGVTKKSLFKKPEA